MSQENIIIIPVRMASQRLPNKPLADILGQSMIQRVYNQALKANVGKVLIACDGEELANEARRINADYVITDPNLPSGTDRIYHALKQRNLKFKTVTNLQGDLPNIDPKLIKTAVELADNSNCDIATLASIIKDQQQITNPNVVKIALTSSNQALYFSRSAIPYSKNFEQTYYHHIGIYVYQFLALEKFVNLPYSTLEKRESLEQLRALENNLKISVAIVDSNPLSVDTKEDLALVIDQIKNQINHD